MSIVDYEAFVGLCGLIGVLILAAFALAMSVKHR